MYPSNVYSYNCPVGGSVPGLSPCVQAVGSYPPLIPGLSGGYMPPTRYPVRFSNPPQPAFTPRPSCPPGQFAPCIGLKDPFRPGTCSHWGPCQPMPVAARPTAQPGVQNHFQWCYHFCYQWGLEQSKKHGGHASTWISQCMDRCAGLAWPAPGSSTPPGRQPGTRRALSASRATPMAKHLASQGVVPIAAIEAENRQGPSSGSRVPNDCVKVCPAHLTPEQCKSGVGGGAYNCCKQADGYYWCEKQACIPGVGCDIQVTWRPGVDPEPSQAPFDIAAPQRPVPGGACPPKQQCSTPGVCCPFGTRCRNNVCYPVPPVGECDDSTDCFGSQICQAGRCQAAGSVAARPPPTPAPRPTPRATVAPRPSAPRPSAPRPGVQQASLATVRRAANRAFRYL